MIRGLAVLNPSHNRTACHSLVFFLSVVDLRTVEHADEPLLVDDTPPIAGDLFDGPYAGRDLAFTKDRNEVIREIP